MRKFSLIIGFFTCLCFAFEAQAKQKKLDEFIGAYAGVGTNFQTNATFNSGFKLRGLRHCPLGFEFVNMAPMGTEIAVPLYLIYTSRFKFHIILPFVSIYVPWQKTPMSVEWLKRKEGGGIDLVLGVGVEYQFAAKGMLADVGFSYVSVGVDWRMFAPNLIWVFPTFGDCGQKIYKQAAEEGQIWLGITFWR